jgi:hypothetical protein
MPLKLQIERWKQTPENLRRLSIDAPHWQTRERFAWLLEITVTSPCPRRPPGTWPGYAKEKEVSHVSTPLEADALAEFEYQPPPSVPARNVTRSARLLVATSGRAGIALRPHNTQGSGLYFLMIKQRAYHLGRFGPIELPVRNSPRSIRTVWECPPLD